MAYKRGGVTNHLLTGKILEVCFILHNPRGPILSTTLGKLPSDQRGLRKAMSTLWLRPKCRSRKGEGAESHPCVGGMSWPKFFKHPNMTPHLNHFKDINLNQWFEVQVGSLKMIHPITSRRLSHFKFGTFVAPTSPYLYTCNICGTVDGSEIPNNHLGWC